MSNANVRREMQQIRTEIASLEARLRRLMIRAGMKSDDPIPQRRLKALVEGSTRRAQ